MASTSGSRSSAPPTGHSLVTVARHGNNWSLSGGGVVTDGAEVLELRAGHQPVTITDVRLVGARGVRLLGARVTGPHRPTYQFFGAPGYPSREGRGSRPAIGATITDARRGWGLLVGLRVASTGFPLIEGVEIRYSVDRGVNHQVYAQVYRGSIIFCTQPPTGSSQDCRPPHSLERLVGFE
ncbi:MAG: hypothetical protein QM747_19150 [Nocardioides sp.]